MTLLVVLLEAGTGKHKDNLEYPSDGQSVCLLALLIRGHYIIRSGLLL